MQPTTQPSKQPTTHPIKLTQSPTRAPTYFTIGTFPNNHSISVLSSTQQHERIPQFKIVLPFLRVLPTISGIIANGFYDIVLSENSTDSDIRVLHGGHFNSILFTSGAKVAAVVMSYDYRVVDL